MTIPTYEPINEVERRLGLYYINIASHGVKRHLGRHISDDVAIVLFDKHSSDETIVSVWDLNHYSAITSRTLGFPLGMLWDWDWRADALEKAVNELSEPYAKLLRDMSPESEIFAENCSTEPSDKNAPRF